MAEPLLSEEQRRRFARQIQLAEVGEAGQRHILSGHAAVAGEGARAAWPLRHLIAAEYASRAGFATLTRAEDLSLDNLAPAQVATQAAPREVLAGSRLAAVALRAAALAACGGDSTRR